MERKLWCKDRQNENLSTIFGDNHYKSKNIVRQYYFICSPSHQRTSTVQGLFSSGSGRRAAVHKHLAKSQNTFGPVIISPMGTPQTPGNKAANNW